MPEFTAKELESKTPEQLATLGERNHPLSAEGILIKDERQKRLMASASPPKTIQWHAKPAGVLLLGVVASLLAAALWFLYGL